MAKQNEQNTQDKPEFTAADRVEYFGKKLNYWTAKQKRLIHKPKIARAKRRVAHYTAKLAEAEAAMIAEAQNS